MRSKSCRSQGTWIPLSAPACMRGSIVVRSIAVGSIVVGSLVVGSLVVGSSGCVQVLGLDGYKEGQGGAGTSGTMASDASSTGSSNGGASSTSMSDSSSSNSSSSSGGAGGSPAASCFSKGKGTVTAFTSPGQNNQRPVIAYSMANHVTYVANSVNADMNGNGAGVTANFVADDDSVGTPQTWLASGGTDVLDMTVDGSNLTVFVRSENQLGQVVFPLSSSGNDFNGVPTFTPWSFTDCVSPDYISSVVLQTPLNPTTPQWAAVCRAQDSGAEKLYVGNTGGGTLVSSEAHDEPADKLNSYVKLISGEAVLLAGGDPQDGAWMRFGKSSGELKTKHKVVSETDANRPTLMLGGLQSTAGGLLLFTATLDSGSVTPAKMFATTFTGPQLSTVDTAPLPGEKQIITITMQTGLAGFAPIYPTPGHLAGAGSAVDGQTLVFTWLTDDGTILARPVITTAPAGQQVSDGRVVAAGSLGSSYEVAWTQSDQTTGTATMVAQMTCIGGP